MQPTRALNHTTIERHSSTGLCLKRVGVAARVRWWLWLALCLAAGFGIGAVLPGCTSPPKPDRLSSPYVKRAVVAVLPLRNESGTGQVDGVIMADQMSRQLEQVDGLIALPVDRVLAAMAAVDMDAIRSPRDVERLRRTLGADAMVIATVTAYDPYDPPLIGITAEMFTARSLEVTTIEHAIRRQIANRQPYLQPQLLDDPDSAGPAVVSHIFNAADAHTRDELERFARSRGGDAGHPDAWRAYRIDMARYTTFVCYATVARLMHVERQRLNVNPVETGL